MRSHHVNLGAGIDGPHRVRRAARRIALGESALTLGSGGVSLFALQFAKAFGADVIATTGSEAKAAAAVHLRGGRALTVGRGAVLAMNRAIERIG